MTEAGEGEDGRMKSAIGIGTLLADGLGDTIRVSLTEDPEFEHAPCNRLAELAAERLTESAHERQRAVPAYEDARDVTLFTRQRGRLPAQRDGDVLDYRGLLHRDGSVLTALPTSELEQLGKMGAFGASALYRAIGCKVSPQGPRAMEVAAPPSPQDTAARHCRRHALIAKRSTRHGRCCVILFTASGRVPTAAAA